MTKPVFTLSILPGMSSATRLVVSISRLDLVPEILPDGSRRRPLSQGVGGMDDLLCELEIISAEIGTKSCIEIWRDLDTRLDERAEEARTLEKPS